MTLHEKTLPTPDLPHAALGKELPEGPYFSAPILVDNLWSRGSSRSDAGQLPGIETPSLRSFHSAFSTEHNQDRKVVVDRRAIPHLPGSLVLNERARIENVRCLGQPDALDPGGVHNI